MSYQLVGDLQMKAMPAITVSQACRILEVSRSGYYAAVKRRWTAPTVCAASVHLRAAFAASGRTYGSRRLCAAQVRRDDGPPQGTQLDVRQRAALNLEAKICTHHRQQARHAGFIQCAG